jgi:hypothetical protein
MEDVVHFNFNSIQFKTFFIAKVDCTKESGQGNHLWLMVPRKLCLDEIHFKEEDHLMIMRVTSFKSPKHDTSLGNMD